MQVHVPMQGITFHMVRLALRFWQAWMSWSKTAVVSHRKLAVVYTNGYSCIRAPSP